MTMANTDFEIDVNIPFSTNRLAEIACNVLRIDAEPKRSRIKKQFIVKDNLLISKFTGNSVKQLRVSVNAFYENISLILRTFEFAGAPVSEIYSYS